MKLGAVKCAVMKNSLCLLMDKMYCNYITKHKDVEWTGTEINIGTRLRLILANINTII